MATAKKITTKRQRKAPVRTHLRAMPKAYKGQADQRYVPSRTRIVLSPGDSVRVARELQEMSQAALSAASGIPQSAISAIEGGHATLGAERAEKLARALKVHPAVLLWPNWDADAKQKAG